MYIRKRGTEIEKQTKNAEREIDIKKEQQIY